MCESRKFSGSLRGHLVGGGASVVSEATRQMADGKIRSWMKFNFILFYACRASLFHFCVNICTRRTCCMHVISLSCLNTLFLTSSNMRKLRVITNAYHKHANTQILLIFHILGSTSNTAMMETISTQNVYHHMAASIENWLDIPGNTIIETHQIRQRWSRC